MTCWDLKMLSTSQARASPVFGLYHPGRKIFFLLSSFKAERVGMPNQ